MNTIQSATGRWYHCVHCWNYSVRPMECCGENMVEEADEDETYEVIAYNVEN